MQPIVDSYRGRRKSSRTSLERRIRRTLGEVALLLHRLRDYRLYLPNPSFGNPAWEAAACRVLVLRLSPFADVQRSTPHLFLFREARAALPGAFIDLAFLPRASDATAFARAGLPLIIGTQSQRTLIDFDIVLVSNSWLLEQVNLPYLLSHSGVPVWASDRTGEWPPLILGGSNAAAAHALVSETGDCMADAMFFGEGEGSVGRIVRRWAENAGLPKRERLARIASEVRGLWIAGSLPGPMNRARAAGSPVPAQAGAPILPGPESATARLSITRGCPCLCSFCFEGHDRKPFREIPAEEVLRSARELKIATGASTLEVESFNFNTHTGIAVLLDGLARMYHRVNLMSQRVDILARTTGLLDLEIAGDKNSFTLGVEGISGRLRGFLHKSLAEDDIRRVVESAHSRKTREMKLFYMLTGRETEADPHAIHTAQARRPDSPGARVAVDRRPREIGLRNQWIRVSNVLELVRVRGDAGACGRRVLPACPSGADVRGWLRHRFRPHRTGPAGAGALDRRERGSDLSGEAAGLPVPVRIP
ncbi:MAG: radical SAM protein [Spirochaetia bacterium]